MVDDDALAAYRFVAMGFVIGLDVGTVGSRAVAIDAEGRVVGAASAAHSSTVLGNGRIEQSPEDWWRSAILCLRSLIGRTGREAIAIGLSGQMDGPVLLDESGRVLGSCHIWADSRATVECEQITSLITRDRLISLAGKPAVPAYTAPKLMWIRAYESGRFERARRILLPKDYVRWRLTGLMATDPSDASNTLLYDVVRRRWNDEIIGALRLPSELLPEVVASMAIAGPVTHQASTDSDLPVGIPVVIGAGDSITAAVANGLVPDGSVLTVLGSAGNVTAVFDRPLIDPEGRVHTGCHATQATWIATGVQQAAGLALQWLRDRFREAVDARLEYEELVAQAERVRPGSDGLMFLPHLTGERSPDYRPRSRAAFFGLSIDHSTGHLVRSVMEGVVFAQRGSIDALRDLGVPVRKIVSAGGGARSRLWRRIQAGVHAVPVGHLETADLSVDSSALGAAIIAGVAVKMFLSLEAAARLVTPHASILEEPDRSEVEVYEAAFARYQDLAERLAPLFETG